MLLEVMQAHCIVEETASWNPSWVVSGTHLALLPNMRINTEVAAKGQPAVADKKQWLQFKRQIPDIINRASTNWWNSVYIYCFTHQLMYTQNGRCKMWHHGSVLPQMPYSIIHGTIQYYPINANSIVTYKMIRLIFMRWYETFVLLIVY